MTEIALITEDTSLVESLRRIIEERQSEQSDRAGIVWRQWPKSALATRRPDAVLFDLPFRGSGLALNCAD